MTIHQHDVQAPRVRGAIPPIPRPAPRPVPRPVPVSVPLRTGHRILVYKQDPSVTDLGARLALLYDTSALPAGRAGRIREAVDALDAARARGGPDGGPGEVGADLPAYRITVDETGEEPRVFEVRGDPAAGVTSVLGALLQGPGDSA
ncbi:Uncharacterised protein [Mycobacterium tuberculosis]|nr:Uncharacterised protein [Mycobacterium tuberculosis]